MTRADLCSFCGLDLYGCDCADPNACDECGWTVCQCERDDDPYGPDADAWGDFGPNPIPVRREVERKRRAAEQRAILARFGLRLRRALKAARERRDVCGQDCLRGGRAGRFDHLYCPVPF